MASADLSCALAAISSACERGLHVNQHQAGHTAPDWGERGGGVAARVECTDSASPARRAATLAACQLLLGKRNKQHGNYPQILFNANRRVLNSCTPGFTWDTRRVWLHVHTCWNTLGTYRTYTLLVLQQKEYNVLLTQPLLTAVRTPACPAHAAERPPSGGAAGRAAARSPRPPRARRAPGAVARA